MALFSLIAPFNFSYNNKKKQVISLVLIMSNIL